MKKLVLLLMIFSATSIYADFEFYYSAGIKIGFNLSKNNNFHIGPEISIIQNTGKDGQFFSGAYLNMDFYMNGNIAINPGFQFQDPLLPGITFGPSVLIDSDTLNVGINAGLFDGFIFYPYFGYHWYPEHKSFFDAGNFLKIPFGKHLPSMSIG